MLAKQVAIASICIGLASANGATSLAKDADGKLAAASPGVSNLGPHSQGALGVSLSEKDGRLSISSVHPESPALRAGLQVGDQIDKVGDSSVSTAKQFIAEITKRAPGSKVELAISRNGEKKTISATLSSVDRLRGASQNRRIQDLERQLSQLQSQVGKLTGNRQQNWPSFQGAGDNGWYYQVEPNDPNQGIQDFGARARDGQ